MAFEPPSHLQPFFVTKLHGNVTKRFLRPPCVALSQPGALPAELPGERRRFDNNVGERGIRPLTIGRKNCLFVGSEDGGKASATILSLVQTCRNLGINPHEYLEDVLRRIMRHPAKQIHKLLPDNWLAARHNTE